MRLKFGTLLTKGRLRMLDNYKRNRFRFMQGNCRMPPAQWRELQAWIHAFEDFMCKGFDWDGVEAAEQDALRHDPSLQQADQVVDRRVPANDARP